MVDEGLILGLFYFKRAEEIEALIAGSRHLSPEQRTALRATGDLTYTKGAGLTADYIRKLMEYRKNSLGCSAVELLDGLCCKYPMEAFRTDKILRWLQDQADNAATITSGNPCLIDLQAFGPGPVRTARASG